METDHVDPAIINVWRCHAAVATLAVAFAACIFLIRPLGSAAFIVIAPIAIVGFVLSWIWPAIYYRHLRYGVDATGILIQRGVLWRSYIALPRVRIQHTDVSQGPLQRRFGVGTLKLYTAGSRHTMIELTGLAHNDALALRDALLAESSASGV